MQRMVRGFAALVVVAGSAMATRALAQVAPLQSTVAIPMGIAPLEGFGGFGLLQPVKGQPYSLTEKTIMVRTLADGTTITSVQEELRWRDIEGRTRTEVKRERGDGPRIDMILISDPVTRTNVSLFVPTKTAHVSHLPERNTLPPEQPAHIAELRARAAQSRETRTIRSPQLTSEKLPAQTVGGVYAEGLRITRIIPIGKEGNDREIRTVSETWTSPDLKIVVGRTMDDPRFGK